MINFNEGEIYKIKINLIEDVPVNTSPPFYPQISDSPPLARNKGMSHVLTGGLFEFYQLYELITHEKFEYE